MALHSTIVVTPPAVEPVTLEEAKLFLRLDGDDEDLMIQEMIVACREMAEQHTRRAFIARTLRQTLDRWPSQEERRNQWWDGVREGPIALLTGDYAPIVLSYPPLIAVTSVTTYDAYNIATVLSPDDYLVDASGGRVILREGTLLPILRERDAVQIVHTAGYGASGSNVPAAIRLAIKQALSSFYEARNCGELPEAALKLLEPYRVRSL
ncbi:head-tail connector protein (plasmid) [Skermanella rosea]|uniref:head-tail connector protein n=1 Tax=Skermanella rosea TaxID=1817965 RepID=UPI0019317995|nr:head-tail connector protein [Skermanella rosea]UEM08069.1 head-tail connector protein [Skermanella rosea]